MRLAPDEPLAAELAVPEEVARRLFVTVRFVPTDFVYAADRPRHAVSFVLERVELLD